MEGRDFGAVLDAAKRGDDAAFVLLFRSVQPMLLRYLRAVGGALAEDVAADTWLSVVRGLRRFEGDEQGWRAWVLTIARARLRDEQRRAVRRPVPVDAEAALAAEADAADVPAEADASLSTRRALALVARLPRDQAEVVLLRHVAGLDVEHTARVVGKKPGTVRVAAHRGLKRLAGLLAESSGADAVPAGNATDRPSD